MAGPRRVERVVPGISEFFPDEVLKGARLARSVPAQPDRRAVPELPRDLLGLRVELPDSDQAPSGEDRVLVKRLGLRLREAREAINKRKIVTTPRPPTVT